MKFRFCGDADCPDWILAEINTISRLSSVKLKLLTVIVAQGIINPPIDLAKGEKLFSDSKLDPLIDLKACIACIQYIISSTVRFNCNSGALNSELQQLGLPREHSNSIKRVIDDYYDELIKFFQQKSLKINSPDTITVDHDTDTTLTYLHLKFNKDNNKKEEKLTLLPTTVKDLLKDLEMIRGRMIELNDNNVPFS